MLKKAFRVVLATLALVITLTGPFVPAAHADCTPAQGTICPH